jgi:hypothetical protein
MGSKTDAVFLLIISGLCGCLIGRALVPSEPRAARALWYLVSGLLAVILSVQLAGALEIAGLVDHASLLSATVIASGIGLLAWGLTPGRRTASEDRTRILGGRLSKGLLIPFIVVALAYGIYAVRIILFYPDGWDALTYQLPLSVKWLQEGTMRIPASQAWRFSQPANANILFLVLLAIGKQSLVPIANWPTVIILALSVYVIALKFSSSNKAAATSALIALSIPMVHQQTFSGYVDLFATAVFTASLALFLCRGGRDRLSDLRAIFASGLACGLSVGTKSSFVVYGGIFVAAATFSLLRERNYSIRCALPSVALLAAGVLIPSLFWFWRAVLQTGNPMFPFQVAIGKTVLFPGHDASEVAPWDHSLRFVRSNWEWLIYPWTEWKAVTGYLHVFYTTGSGLGAAFAAFVPLGVVVAVYQFMRDVRRRILPRTIVIATWLILLVVWFLAIPRLPRYGLPLWPLACALSAQTLALAWRYRPAWTGRLLSVTLVSTMVISCYEPVYGLVASLRGKTFSRSDFYEYPKFIDQLPAGSRIVNQAGPFNFLFYGERLANRVIPDFEQPVALTRDFLDRVDADYVLERKSVGQPPLAPVEGLILAEEEVRVDEQPPAIWRLWSVSKQEALQPAAWQRDIHGDALQ